MSIQLHQIKTFLVYSFVIFILPACWLPLVLYRSFVILLVRLTKPNFGKVFNPVDIVVEEAGISQKGYIPKSSIVNSVTLEDPISLQELRDLFQKNVLEAWASSSSVKTLRFVNINNNNNNNEDRIRYPELKQYPVSFMGHTFWKEDEGFRIENHVVEQFYETGKQPRLDLLHQEMVNKSFIPRRTPWEIILINNYRDDDNEGGATTRSLIIARFHHSMADARSVLKLFVECLGEKSLKTAKPQPVTSSYGIMDILKIPINYALIITFLVTNSVKFWTHPWKCKRSDRRMTESKPQLVRLSAKLPLKDAKEIGKESGGTLASVIIAIISGSIRRIRPDLGKVFSAYILPKDNHPETLVNHAGFGALILPSDDPAPYRRLQKSHKVFQELKALNMGKYLDYPLSTIATLFNPMRSEISYEMMSACPIGITNIAGEGEGFSVGKRECSEYIISVGTLLCDTGIVFCISSYKEHFRIAVISQEGILAEVEADQLASMMGKELEALKKLCL